MTTNWNADLHPRTGDGKWTNADNQRDDHGQILDSLNVAQAMGDDYATERAQEHLRDVAIAELAGYPRDIKMFRYGDDPNGQWYLDEERMGESVTIDGDLYADGDEPVSEEELPRLRELLNDVGTDELNGLSGPHTYDVDHGDGVTTRMVLSREQLQTRARTSNWATAADQDALFEMDVPDNEYVPNSHPLPMRDRDGEEEVGTGSVFNPETGTMEFTRLRVKDFEEASPGVWRNREGGYVMLDPWRESKLPEDIREEGRVPGSKGVFYDTALDVAVPFRPVNDYDKAVFQNWPSLNASDDYHSNLVRRAMVARTPADRAERVENMVNRNNISLSGLDESASTNWDDYTESADGWDGVEAKAETGGGYVGYRLSPEANNRIPESLRSEDGVYTGDRALVVDAVSHPDPEEARNAIMLLAEREDIAHIERFDF